MSEVEIGWGKRARRAYTLDDVAVAPRRRTRDADEVSTSWQFDAYHLNTPTLSVSMDSASSPATAIEIGGLGGVGILDLEGLWTRYEDPTEEFARITRADPEEATSLSRRLYSVPTKRDLIFSRLAEIHSAGVSVAGALSPGRTQDLWKTVVDVRADLFVIRGMTVSAEHVSASREPLNLKRFVYELEIPILVGGAVTYIGALHLMCTDAAGAFAGYREGATSVTRRTVGIAAPMTTAVADIAAARRDYLDESGGRYVHVIVDGSVSTSGDLVRAIVCGASAVMFDTALARAVGAPGRGWYWGLEAWHGTFPRGGWVEVATVGSLCDIPDSPSHQASGFTNFMGALRHVMAANGYLDLKGFQRAELIVTA